MTSISGRRRAARKAAMSVDLSHRELCLASALRWIEHEGGDHPWVEVTRTLFFDDGALLAPWAGDPEVIDIVMRTWGLQSRRRSVR